VVVLGFEAWVRLFDAGTDALGRAVRVGDEPATVVGVLPEGYEFPPAEVWMPLRLDPLAYEPRAGPGITVFGRLAPTATLEQAQSELSALGERAARDNPRTHAQLRPRVTSFPAMFFPFPGFFSPELLAANLFVIAVIVLLGSNVALLMFARTAAREGELTVRSALGAGRRRIVGQLFAESLVLATFAAALGIAAARYIFRWGVDVVSGIEGAFPFWISRDLSPESVAYGAVLTVIVAAVAGVWPGLQATARPLPRLREATAGGGGVRFGGVWTAVIVTQVALTVIFPAFTLFLWQDGQESMEADAVTLPFDLVAARLEADGDTWGETWEVAEETTPLGSRYAAALVELERRLDADPTVRAFGFIDVLPRDYHYWNQIELDGGAVEPLDGRGHRVARAEVSLGFFGAFDAPIVAGRPFDTRDQETGAPVVVVDEPFVERVLGGRSPVGRLVRYVARQPEREPVVGGPWYEIVGVVGDLGLETGFGRGGIYHLAAPGSYPPYLVASATGDASELASRLRGIAASVDPSLQVQDAMPLDDLMEADRALYRYWMGLSIVLTGIILLLSLAGTYSVTSFMVTRRTREIGLRVALGANPVGILRAIMKRPMRRVVLGIVLGSAWVGLMVRSGISTAEELGPRQFGLLGAYAVLMLGVSLLACVVPARRALAVEPRDALAADG
jgi:predicted permease